MEIYEKLIKTSFKLNKSEMSVYMTLLGSNVELDMRDLIALVGKDRTTIQRTLNKLEGKGMIVHRQENLHKGFKYLYWVDDKASIKQNLKDVLELNLEMVRLIK